jgi:hypothetical protein
MVHLSIYYVPRSDNKTSVVLSGEFRSFSVDLTVWDHERLRSIVSSTIEKVFDEDCAYLKKHAINHYQINLYIIPLCIVNNLASM